MNKICPICKTEYGSGEVFCPVDAARLSTRSQMSGKKPEVDDPLVGTQLDKYQVIRRVGEGGMGLVYEAMHTFIEKQVAIKVLRDDFSKRPEVVERFRQEAKSASRIGHANIVDISDFGETPQGASYFVMEYLAGEDLANVLARETTVGPGRAVNILQQCCRALGAAHSKGIVHRDMKPENIFLTQREGSPDFVKIVDFGIAKMSDIETEGAPGRKLTKTGMIFGTPEYMSPEQAAGKSLDHRVDVYALGVILYELLTGRVPFVGDSFMGILTQHMFEDAPPLRETNPHADCSPELEMVVFKALAKDPSQRYQDMDELHEALTEALQGRVSAATLVGFGGPAGDAASGPRQVRALDTGGEFPARRSSNRGVIAAAVAVLAIGIGIGAVVAFSGPEDDIVAANETPPEPVPAAQPPIAPPVETPPVDDSVQPAATEPETPETIALTVITQPPGAEIDVDGDVEGCAPSPCQITAPVGETLVIQATKGRSRGSEEVEVTEETHHVELRLQARRPRRPRDRGNDSSMPPTKRSDELKMPDVLFQ